MNTTPESLSQGELHWCGEHWMVYLRPKDSEEDTSMVSLYHAYTSPAGRGSAAFVEVKGDNGFKGYCTDNPAFAEWVKDTLLGAYTPYDVDMPKVEAEFKKGGDIRKDPAWTITAQSREIVTTWTDLDEPLVAPGFANTKIVFSILYFPDSGSIVVDGMPGEGQPYSRDDWKRFLGEAKSSCCFALAETMIK
jgi:hypothetical protein